MKIDGCLVKDEFDHLISVGLLEIYSTDMQLCSNYVYVKEFERCK